MPAQTPNGYQPGTRSAASRRADFDLLRRLATLEGAVVELVDATPDGAWNGKPMRLGTYYLWIDGTGRLRIKPSAPTSITDGTVIGTQT